MQENVNIQLNYDNNPQYPQNQGMILPINTESNSQYYSKPQPIMEQNNFVNMNQMAQPEINYANPVYNQYQIPIENNDFQPINQIGNPSSKDIYLDEPNPKKGNRKKKRLSLKQLGVAYGSSGEDLTLFMIWFPHSGGDTCCCGLWMLSNDLCENFIRFFGAILTSPCWIALKFIQSLIFGWWKMLVKLHCVVVESSRDPIIGCCESCLNLDKCSLCVNCNSFWSSICGKIETFCGEFYKIFSGGVNSCCEFFGKICGGMKERIGGFCGMNCKFIADFCSKTGDFLSNFCSNACEFISNSCSQIITFLSSSYEFCLNTIMSPLLENCNKGIEFIFGNLASFAKPICTNLCSFLCKGIEILCGGKIFYNLSFFRWLIPNFEISI